MFSSAVFGQAVRRERAAGKRPMMLPGIYRTGHPSTTLVRRMASCWWPLRSLFLLALCRLLLLSLLHGQPVCVAFVRISYMPLWTEDSTRILKVSGKPDIKFTTCCND